MFYIKLSNSQNCYSGGSASAKACCKSHCKSATASSPTEKRTRWPGRSCGAGRLRMASPELAANQFFMMLFGDLVIRISSGYVRDPKPEELSAYARGAVDLFLRGALPR